jgi:hypothetical protein
VFGEICEAANHRLVELIQEGLKPTPETPKPSSEDIIICAELRAKGPERRGSDTELRAKG